MPEFDDLIKKGKIRRIDLGGKIQELKNNQIALFNDDIDLNFDS